MSKLIWYSDEMLEFMDEQLESGGLHDFCEERAKERSFDSGFHYYMQIVLSLAERFDTMEEVRAEVETHSWMEILKRSWKGQRDEND